MFVSISQWRRGPGSEDEEGSLGRAGVASTSALAPVLGQWVTCHRSLSLKLLLQKQTCHGLPHVQLNLRWPFTEDVVVDITLPQGRRDCWDQPPRAEPETALAQNSPRADGSSQPSSHRQHTNPKLQGVRSVPGPPGCHEASAGLVQSCCANMDAARPSVSKAVRPVFQQPRGCNLKVFSRHFSIPLSTWWSMSACHSTMTHEGPHRVHGTCMRPLGR